jgi:hypothetical protein
VPPVLSPASHPILWGDWSRCQTRRAWMTLLRTQTVTVTVAPLPALTAPPASVPLTRAQRAHWRLSWEQRLACNACSSRVRSSDIHLFGIPVPLASSLGLVSSEPEIIPSLGPSFRRGVFSCSDASSDHPACLSLSHFSLFPPVESPLFHAPLQAPRLPHRLGYAHLILSRFFARFSCNSGNHSTVTISLRNSWDFGSKSARITDHPKI